MQRVLSFPPPTRGFGDPSEFVSKRMCFSFMFSLAFLAFLGGFLLGRFVFDQELELSRNKLKKAHLHHQQVFGTFKNYSQYNVSSILDDISETALLGHMALLKNYSSSDSASRAIKEAELLQKHLSSNGFDLVSPLVESQIHLSYPSSRHPNQAVLLESGGKVILQINDTRQTYKDDAPESPPSTANVEGNVIYVNFGRNEDYLYLDSLGISARGNIVLIRAGGIPPIDMVNNALDHDALGILIYLDPQQEGVKLPLLTPGDLAKIQIMQGNEIDKWSGKIPLLEISSSDAEKMFAHLSATEPSAESWRGKLNSNYPIGSGFSKSNLKLKMQVNTVNTVKTYFDIVGAMRGSQEPDRFVVLACEKSDEKQVQAAGILMEIVRVFGNLKEKGWIPHRSIVVAFWGLEGPNQHIVSFPETVWSQLITKTVTYLKVDSSYDAGYNQTQSVATPILEKLYYRSAETASMKNLSMDMMLPLVMDNIFIQYGIPFLALSKFKPLTNNTLKEITSFWGVATWDLAESHGLPFSLNSYDKFFSHSIGVVEKRFKTIAQKYSLFLETLLKSVRDLVDTIRLFDDKWSHADKSKSIEMRIMNDQLLDFVHSINCNKEQGSASYLLSSGHLIFSKSFTGNDEKAGFGILQNLLRETTSTRTPEDLHRQIITHLASLVECINMARYVGLRVNQVYDIDHKTYLFRLQKTDEKIVILIESGTRIHTTDFEWPKNVAPSGFSMKLRKHLRNKRLESLRQLGFDRIVDMQFGTGEAAYHVFLELYDKGNIILTDCDLVILNVLRPHTEGDRIRFAVREKYPIDRAREGCNPPSESELREFFNSAKAGDNLKKILNPQLEYGPAVLEHVLLGVNLQGTTKLDGQNFHVDKVIPKVVEALKEAEEMMKKATMEPSKGYIIKKVEKRPSDDGLVDFHVNQEFHPFLFRQHVEGTWTESDTFLKAVDSFYSSLESQKIDMKAINQEKEALKKIENVRKDHDQRLQQLLQTQELDRIKAELITNNLTTVDQAILAVRTAIANQMAWTDIEAFVKQGKAMGDPVASSIKGLKLDINHITLQLSDPYDSESSNEEGDEKPNKMKKSKTIDVDIDLDLTAFANARRYYDQKRSAAKKQQKTIESQDKALKSAEKKTKQALKEMKAIVNISKVRKTLWFEKFFWFISSENYLVIGGRDMTQNELIVKRYMKAGDLYVHADIHGASSVVIKNPTGEPVPPKTLNEAGIMAICYSVAWDAKVVTSAWWVHSAQVSKTAPTGEYLTAGSFMVRGKKNYLPPGNLIMGFSFLFKLEENSVARHKDERKVKSSEDEMISPTTTAEEEDVEIVLSEDDDDEEGEGLDHFLKLINFESGCAQNFKTRKETM
ncbi:hypothetical protein RUM43_007472 [Polyplax serrata]|uniref:NFACT RNA-binding domain-containing protein n=1 Tax=Polyplax serrata TaxID=468196 RepID=A0AAN8PX75_POLSC